MVKIVQLILLLIIFVLNWVTLVYYHDKISAFQLFIANIFSFFIVYKMGEVEKQ